MPYKIQKQDGKHCVVKEDGKQIACHPTRAKAMMQMRALYANEKADLAAAALPCAEEDCARQFLSFDVMLDHLEKVHGEDVEEARKFTADERKQAAKKGQAKSDGSFVIKNAEDLKNAIRLYGNAKDPAAAKAHIIKRAKALGLTSKLPKGWTSDGASIECPECPRTFLDEAKFVEHAEAVHTFDDIREIVAEAISEKYGSREGDYNTRIYVYVRDLADDWVVFEASQGSQSDSYKCSYSIVDNVATLGQITEVRRRTVWEPVGANEPAGILSTQEGN